MTVNSWADVPEGVAAHHHCVVSVEKDHDPKFWVDASQAVPDLVAWDSRDAVAWVLEQLKANRDDASEARRQGIDELLHSYDPHPVWRPAPDAGIPTLWERLPNTLGRGRWAMETFQLSTGRKLVLQILGYANHDQPRGRYAACTQHHR